MRNLLPLLLLASPVFALEPKDVFVVANKDSKDSRAVAQHYLEKRKVPVENLLELSLPLGEDISRADYESKLAGPLREHLKEKKLNPKVILTVYGVPLRVGAKVVTDEDKAELEKIKPLLEAAKKEGDKKKEAEWEAKQLSLNGDQSVASVDSELMLLHWPKYDPTRWIINPLHWQMTDADRKKSPPVLMTARLDGPTPEIAKRLVDDALTAEKNGLKGKAYFDARGLKLDPKNADQWTGYQGYDESYREAADLMKKAGFETVLDDQEALFKPNACPDAALYSGWYSLANYIDSFTFPTGAIAWHLASSEAVTLRDAKSKLWCPNLLQKGVAATLGPVAEPYTVGFPKPSEFFGFLATGEFTLVECYARTTILTSWMMVLVGDPLYNPFANSKKLKVADVFPSPKGSTIIGK